MGNRDIIICATLWFLFGTLIGIVIGIEYTRYKALKYNAAYYDSKTGYFKFIGEK